ncbi:site-specific tyrosine recombinase/integron integrase [Flavobacterium filum]|uniref:site-specific tyrosine recombinase/integron integrase n=1 Tax=Flavobacterium filum TaxID=370974 RepID=UPI0023F25623|nr:site-specific tyrosine recombinase/integron integrase [Flavobacterium filum]
MEKKYKWSSKLTKHKGEKRIIVEFEKNDELIKRIKAIEGSKWSRSLRSWHVPDTSENRIRFKLETKTQQELNDVKLEKVELFKQWLKSKRYSENTTKTYSEAIKVFLYYFKEKAIEEIKNQDIVDFNNDYILKNHFSNSYQNQVVNAIKLFLKVTLGLGLDVELIHRPKREKKLPNVLSKQEVKAILNSLTNIKHRTMLSLIYSCGLRSGELLKLKPEHVDSNRNLLIIKQSKGKKDRIAPLSHKTIEILREYYKSFKPKKFLFEGQQEGHAYDSRSLQQVLKQALSKAGISKPVTLHWLRHSYATHLLENGTDLRYIQEILGHSSSRTTEIYTHVSTQSIQHIISPFDLL